jgi:DNA helicase-2/ATP-dependent DNA helicase PcrA
MADPFDDDSLFAATQGTVSAGEAGPTRADPLPTEWEPAHAKAAERGVLLTTLTMEELTEGLNEAQALAVTTTQGPLLVVAGPGSGKTKVLTHRVGALLVEGVPAWRILAVTFTNKASGEMRSRLTTLVGEAGKDLWVSTFHSLCVKLLRRYGSVVGLSASFTILDQDDSLKMVKEATLACGGTKEDGKTMQRLISYAKNNLMNPGDIPGAPGKLFHVAQEYEQRKMRASVVDFDDLLLQLHAALGHEEVASALRAKFSYVLVDEYQDTNRVQYEILRAITSESRNLCVVGDADQSVYAWRGAFPGVLDGFLTDYSEAKVVKLEQNYRSTKKVLEVASAVISPNPTKARADLWTENPEGESIRLVEMGDDRDEAAWVVADLGRTTGTTAVIVRTNSQTKPFEDALMASHRPFQLVGAQRFFDRSEVRDAMAWLRCGLNHGDRLALTRAAGSPKRGLGEKSLRAWFELAEELGVTPTSLGEEELAGLGGRASKGVAAFISDVRSVSDAAGEGPEAALKAVVRLGLLKDMERERAENIDQLLASAAEFDFAGRGGFEVSVDFVESVALTGAADAGSEKGDASPLYLITAHAAKGRYQVEW